MQPERRRSLRVPDSRQVVVVCGAATFDALLTNLSPLGALLVGPPGSVAVGKSVRVQIPVAAGGMLLAEGHVVRVGSPTGSIALTFDRPLNEFPVEHGPVTGEPPPLVPEKSNPIATGCLIAVVALAGVFALGALILAFKS